MLCACVSTLAILQATAANAQEAAPSAPVAEVIVTANKRSERLQDVPQTVTAVSGQQLLRQNITTINDLSDTTPALETSSGINGTLRVRGIGTQAYAKTAEGSVGIVVDNVALSNAVSPFAPTSLFDVERVEVLEGPQGTLFGRGSDAGVLNITTTTPKFGKLEEIGHLDVGSRDSLLAQAAINVPLGDDAALRISGHFDKAPETVFSSTHDKWDDNEDEGARARLLWKPTNAVTVNIIADYDNDLDRNDNFVSISAAPGSLLAKELATCGIKASNQNHDTCDDGSVITGIATFGLSGQIDYALNGFTLSSITAGRWSQTSTPTNIDSDSTPLDILSVNGNRYHISDTSEELRLASPSGPLQYILGLYYFSSSQGFTGYQDGTLGAVPVPATLGYIFSDISQTHSYAGFGQATYRVTDRIRLIVGGRLDREDVSAVSTRHVYPGAVASFTSLFGPSGSTNDTDFSYKLGAQYDVTRDVMAYLTYTKGYKGPSVNDGSTSATAPLIVKPEIPHAFELGLKSSWFERRLAVNADLFHTEIDNFQTTVYDSDANTFVFGNAPSLTSQGAELEVYGQPLPGLSINGGFAYIDAKYGSGYFVTCGPTQTAAQGCLPRTVNGHTTNQSNADGAPLVGAPKYKLTLSGEYFHRAFEGWDGFLDVDAVYTSSIYYNAAYDPGSVAGDHFVVGGKLGLRTPDSRFGVSLYVRNLTDQRIPTYLSPTPLAAQLGDLSAHSAEWGPESFRTFGVSLDAKF